MIRFNAVVIASLLLLVSVTGCNNAEDNASVVTTPMVARKKAPKPKAAAPQATASASPGTAKTPASPADKAAAKTTASPGKPKASPAKTTASVKDDLKPTLAKLNGYLPAAVNALQANDVEKAKQYAKDFNANWQQKIIQYTVKTKSQDAYKKISAGVTEVNNNLIKPEKPDNAKAIAALKSLSQSVKDYTANP